MDKQTQQKAKSGAFWTIGTKIGLTIARVAIVAILARLIEPEGFGVFATFIIVYEFAKISYEPFINKNLILNQVDSKFTSAAITVSFIHGVVIAVIVFVLAPFLGTYFNMRELVGLLRIGAFLIVIMAISNPWVALIEKSIDFKWLAKRKAIASLVGSGAFSIFFAWLNLGYWALFIGFIITEVINSLLVIIKKPITWKSHGIMEVKELYRNAVSITMESIVSMVALKGDYLIVSKFLGASSLGFYSKAYQLMSMPTNLVAQALNKIGFASLANYQDDKIIQKKMFLRLSFLVAITLIPLSVVLFFLSKDIILLVLGRDWLQSLSPFKVLLFGIFFRLAYKIPGTLLQIQRRFKTLLLIQSIYATFILLGSYLMVSSKLEGIAFAVLFAVISEYLIMTISITKSIDVKFSEIVRAYSVPVGYSILTAVCLFTLKVILPDSFFLVTVIVLAIGVLSLILIKTELLLGEYGKWWKNKLKING